ncbi:outer membrane protein assembly factor BamE domain-containing protein [Pleomorphomonas sp. T1.2MG-36]|uniref:outer membrane protein assembly factor BamE domain-containing protein n=1 Tax=Pleomorphomonas sp. T1.2MG-36 TaxID=3041167 RepID=UPI00406C754E
MASREKLSTLEPGMSKEQVVKVLGQPDSSRLRNGESCLMYSMWRDFWNRRPGDYSDRYFACFSNNKLTSYGRVGDDF